MNTKVDPYKLEEILKKLDEGEIESAIADVYKFLEKEPYSGDNELKEVYSLLGNFEDKTAPQQKSALENSKEKLDEMIEWRRLEESGGGELPVQSTRGKKYNSSL